MKEDFGHEDCDVCAEARERDALRAQVAQLREAMEHILECADYEAHGIARKALGMLEPCMFCGSEVISREDGVYCRNCVASNETT